MAFNHDGNGAKMESAKKMSCLFWNSPWLISFNVCSLVSGLRWDSEEGISLMFSILEQS